MIDVALLAARLLLLVLLYLFLLAAIRAGIGLVSGQSKPKPGGFVLRITQGPDELRGVTVGLDGPVVIGRSPGADIVIGDDFVSARHARISPVGAEAIVEDLGSTNGTLLNGLPLSIPTSLRPGDTIDIGAVRLTVDTR